MLAKDIADDELALGALRGGDDLLGVRDVVGERLLDEHMRAASIALMAKSAWVSGRVLIDTTSGFSSASACSKLSNVFALR